MKNRRFTQQEDDIIRELYPDTDTKEIAKQIDRSCKSVCERASKLGVKKTEAYQRWRMLNWGEKTRYGTNGRYYRKPFGKKSPHKPIGAMRKVSKGYWQVKTSGDNGNYKDWEFLHHIIYKKHHGEIPPGHVCGFIDGNPDNLDISNIAVIDKKTADTRRITKHPELTGIYGLLGVLQKEIMKVENGK